jgi:hypothetical protein
MKRRSFVAVLTLLVVLGLAPSAAADCVLYFDSKAGVNPFTGDTFCWLSGEVCIQCYNPETGDDCAANWQTCRPDPPAPPSARLRIFDPQTSAPIVQACSIGDGAQRLTTEKLL